MRVLDGRMSYRFGRQTLRLSVEHATNYAFTSWSGSSNGYGVKGGAGDRVSRAGPSCASFVAQSAYLSASSLPR